MKEFTSQVQAIRKDVKELKGQVAKVLELPTLVKGRPLARAYRQAQLV